MSTATVIKTKEIMRQADNPPTEITPLPPPHLLKPNVLPSQTDHPGGVWFLLTVYVSFEDTFYS